MSGAEAVSPLKKYRLVAEIGQGGMAGVFLAVAQGAEGFNKLVVIKKMRPELALDQEMLAMFLDEARLSARLSHPNIVQTYEIGSEGQNYFITMEYLEGKPLSALRASSRKAAILPPVMQVRVLCDTLAALEYAHELRDYDGTRLEVVHRDVSPQNVFVTYQGTTKLLDFGIAKALDSSTQTRTGVVKGKVAYISPEQARGRGVDRRADVFAVGVLLWEAFAGRRMWKGLPDITIIHELLTESIPSLRAVVPDLDPRIEAIIARALAPIEQRYPTAAAMHDDLEKYLATTPERPSSRDIGALVTAPFAEDRERVRALVEAQLRDVRWSGTNPRVTATGLPSIQLQTPTATGQFSEVRPKQPADTGSSPTRVDTPMGSTGQTGTVAGGLTSDHRPRSRAPVFVAALAVGVAIAALAFGVHLAPSKSGASATAEPAATTTAASTAPVTAAPSATAIASATAAASDAQHVHLRVTVEPKSARVFLDDVLISTGAFEGELARSDGAKKLRVEADGRETREESVSLAKDLVVEVKLPEARGAAVRRPPPPPSPTPEPAATPAPAPTGQRPSREIDRDNPYAKKKP